MTDATPQQPDTVTLSTKVEEAFVSPLTAVRGFLEILRDFPDLEADKRQHFVTSALIECGRLERGVEELAEAVYAAARQPRMDSAAEPIPSEFADRIRLDRDQEIFEIDFEGYVFKSSEDVNRFFDAIDAQIERSGRQWFVLANHSGCSVWPEAWVAFAHRGKKIAVNHALGIVRYDQAASEAKADMAPSRAEALAQIDRMKRETR